MERVKKENRVLSYWVKALFTYAAVITVLFLYSDKVYNLVPRSFFWTYERVEVVHAQVGEPLEMLSVLQTRFPSPVEYQEGIYLERLDGIYKKVFSAFTPNTLDAKKQADCPADVVHKAGFKCAYWNFSNEKGETFIPSEPGTYRSTHRITDRRTGKSQFFALTFEVSNEE
ncbi:MAG: hypothetical protein KC422_24920 [Trueperaceae bacterium]|nr:hypothetical protein [Trueperaceae bacterium]